MTPLLSVLVPTHNRSIYAKSCIEAILAQEAPDLQLVVSDTSTDGKLFDWLQGEGAMFAEDRRLVYRKIDTPSNVTKNHEDAMALATGEYVSVIGDDDCITSAIVDAARWASAEGIPAVSQTQTAIYAWPDFRSQLARAGHATRLYVPRRIGKARWRDAQRDLVAALGRACQSTVELPRTYHGIVRRDLFEKINERTGAFYHASSPDMWAAIGIATLIDRYCEVDLPLSISGISRGSNSGRSAMNTHKGDLSSDPQTREFERGGWPVGVPRYFSVETVWAHAGLEATQKLRPEFVHHFNYAKLLALCAIRHPDFEAANKKAAEEVAATTGRDIGPEIEREVSRERWARIRYLVGRALVPTAAHGRRYFSGLATVAAASASWEKYARAKKFSFQQAIQRLA
jgi:hypothetical protein